MAPSLGKLFWVDVVDLDRPAVCAQREEEHAGENHHSGVEEIEHGETERVVQVDDRRRDQPAEADTQVHEHEVEAEGPLAVLFGNESAEQRAAGTPAGPSEDRNREARDEGHRPGVGKGPEHERARAGRVAEEPDRYRAEAVDRGAPDWARRESREGAQREQERREAGRKPSHVVQVHHEEREGEPVADAAEERAEVEATQCRVDRGSEVRRNESVDQPHEASRLLRTSKSMRFRRPTAVQVGADILSSGGALASIHRPTPVR